MGRHDFDFKSFACFDCAKKNGFDCQSCAGFEFVKKHDFDFQSFACFDFVKKHDFEFQSFARFEFVMKHNCNGQNATFRPHLAKRADSLFLRCGTSCSIVAQDTMLHEDAGDCPHGALVEVH